MNSSSKKYDVLGEGSYGCVIKPALPCDSKIEVIAGTRNGTTSNQNLVSKVFEKKINYKKELDLSKKLAKIDPFGENFLLPKKGCILNNSKFLKIKNICTKRHFNIYEKNYQLVMPYGGIDMKEYIKNTKITFKDFINASKSLLDSIELLKTHNYCHQDIKFDNVLIDDKKMILIDYGLMKKFNSIYKPGNNKRLLKNYYPYPPEYKLVFYFNERMQNFIEESLNNIKEIIKKVGNFIDFFSEEEIINKLKEMYNKYHKLAKNKTEIIKIMTKYADKIDIYSTGVLFAISGNIIKFKNKDYKELIKKMIEFDPEYRIDCDECKKLLNKL